MLFYDEEMVNADDVKLTSTVIIREPFSYVMTSYPLKDSISMLVAVGRSPTRA